MAEPDNDLMADVRAAATEIELPPESVNLGTPPEKPVETEAETEARTRDEQGRFAKEKADKEAKTLTAKDLKPAKDAPTGQNAIPAPVEPPKVDEAVKGLEIPPVNWKGSAKIDWGRMPLSVRTEIVEQHNRVAEAERELVPLKELIDLNREHLVSQAGSVAEGLRQLLQFEKISRDKPYDLIQHIAQSRGLDLRALVLGQQGQPGIPQQQQPQDIQAIIAQAVEQRLQPLLAQSQQERTQQVYSTIEQFRADPKHPYFNDVADQMERLIRSGAAKDLPDAYDQAVWMNPTIRTQLMQGQAEELAKSKAAEADKARRAAAASLTGSPIHGTTVNGTGAPNSSALDDVRNAFRELSGA